MNLEPTAGFSNAILENDPDEISTLAEAHDPESPKSAMFPSDIADERYRAALNGAFASSSDDALARLALQLDQRLVATGLPRTPLESQAPEAAGMGWLRQLDGSNLARIVADNRAPYRTYELGSSLTRVALEIECGKQGQADDKMTFLVGLINSASSLRDDRALLFTADRVLGSLSKEEEDAILTRVGPPPPSATNGSPAMWQAYRDEVNARCTAMSSEELRVVAAVLAKRLGGDRLLPNGPNGSPLAQKTAAPWLDALDGTNLARLVSVTGSELQLLNTLDIGHLNSRLIELEMVKDGPTAAADKFAFAVELLKPHPQPPFETPNTYVALMERQKAVVEVLGSLDNAAFGQQLAQWLSTSPANAPEILGNLAGALGAAHWHNATEESAQRFKAIVDLVRSHPDKFDHAAFFDALSHADFTAVLQDVPNRIVEFCVLGSVAAPEPQDGLIRSLSEADDSRGRPASGLSFTNLSDLVARNGSEVSKVQLAVALLRDQETRHFAFTSNSGQGYTKLAPHEYLARTPEAVRLLTSVSPGTLARLSQDDEFLQPFAAEILKRSTP